jgi:hypothetical protein
VFADLRAKPRLSRIESLPVFIPNTRLSQPPSKTGTPRTSYQRLSDTDLGERQGQNEPVDEPGLVRPVTPVSASDENTPLPLTSSNLAQLEDVRYGEVAHTAQLKNRISTVSQYPVLMNTSPSNDGRRRSQRIRPASITSTSTNGIYVTVGKLPGSEPFDLEPPSQDILSRHYGIPAQHVPVTNNGAVEDRGQEGPVVQTAQAVHVQIVGSQNNHSTTSVNRISIISNAPKADGSPRRSRGFSASGANQFPPRVTSIHPPPMRASRTWPDNLEPQPQQMSTGPRAASWTSGRYLEEIMVQQQQLVAGGDSPVPPPPPPKDPGYIVNTNARRPAPSSRLRHVSSPNPVHMPLNATPRASAVERVGLAKEQGGPRDHKRRHRSWLGGLLNFAWNSRSSRSSRSPRSPRSPMSPLRHLFSYRQREFAR